MIILKFCKVTTLVIAASLVVLTGLAFSESQGFPGYYLHDDFRRYPAAEVYRGMPAPVDLESDPMARRFRTKLTEGAKEGPNFAGMYTVVEWGCGTNCQQLAVVDASTGKVCDWLTTEFGAKYTLSSKLLIKNPDTAICSQLEWCKTKYYIFEAQKFTLIK